MITKVRLKFFKRFEDQEFDLTNPVVLAGPNNSGKSTLLQALSVWNLCLQRWLSKTAGKSTAKIRTGIPISRKDFTAIPLREMDLLWTDRGTGYLKNEYAEKKTGAPKLIEISVFGLDSESKSWELILQLRYSSREQVYLKFVNSEDHPLRPEDIPQSVRQLQIVHIPPFAGIGAEETRYDRGYQYRIVGQGKPGDILRNLLWEVFDKKTETGQPCREDWTRLKKTVQGLFNLEMLDPSYSEAADPFIVIEYMAPKNRKPFDLASAGSGFHQVLTILAFLFSRPASIFLVDEPDAHEHVILQRQVYDMLCQLIRQQNGQLIISTHSEVILEDTDPVRILSFYGKPHRLRVDTEKGQTREALKRLSSMDILQAESGENILYLEGESDLKILREFAKIIAHPLHTFLEKPFIYLFGGRGEATETRGHFFGLRAMRDHIRGVMVLDGDNKNLKDHDVDAEGMIVLRWIRYEIENYLLNPDALSRYVQNNDLELSSERVRNYLKDRWPPDAIRNPLGDNEYLMNIPASKNILPEFFKAMEIQITKKDYFQIATCFTQDQIHPEIREKLDKIAGHLLSGK